MKPILCFIFAVGLLTTHAVNAQKNIKIPPKFISFKHSKFSMGASLEAGVAVKASKPATLKTIYKDPRTESSVPYVSYGLTLDLYSANSVIGFLSGLDFSKFSFGVQESNNRTDFYDIRRIEIPLYLKIRPGKVDGKHHAWILLGGIYNLPEACKREQFDASLGNGASITVLDQNKEQINSFFSLSGSLGYEAFVLGEQKHLRVAFYSKVTYPLSNELNTEYREYKNGGNGILVNYPNFDIRHYRITFGIKILLQFGQAASIMLQEAIKK
jgi:hypothetical protein